MRPRAFIEAAVASAVLAAAVAALAGGAAPGVAEVARPLAEADTRLDREEAPLGVERASEVYREANALYAEGVYDGAARRYERIVGGGIENADVRYNLANAYFKSGALGRAVLNYERALRLDPGHEDARANLEFVRELLADRQASVGGPMSELLEAASAGATPSRLAALASLLYFVLVAALTVGILRGAVTGWSARLAVVTGILLVVVCGALAARLYQERSIREAVILAQEVAVRTGPGEDFVLEFRLHEGTKVRAREERGDWIRVSVGGTDLEGWLPAGSLEEI
jgi:tetratricopeptide (TPR) repeat protein